MQMKLLLVDDHLLFMESLQYLLQTYNIEVVGKASNGKEAIEIARELNPDIILMDIRMPGYSGLEALKQIKSELPDIKIIILTTSDEDEDLYDAIKYGASGYLLKSTDAKELINILEQVMNNEAFLSSDLALRLLSEFRQKEREVNPSSRNLNSYLTDRQIEILEMVAKGITYKEVGETIGLTERTVKYHMGRILEQLHLENRSQVIAFASLGGLFDNK